MLIIWGLTTNNIFNRRWIEPPKRLDNSKKIYGIRGKCERILMYLIDIGIKRNSRNKIDWGVLKLNLNTLFWKLLQAIYKTNGKFYQVTGMHLFIVLTFFLLPWKESQPVLLHLMTNLHPVIVLPLLDNIIQHISNRFKNIYWKSFYSNYVSWLDLLFSH